MIELREGDRVVELNPGEKIIQSFRATDFRNIGERSGAYSNQFTVPVTNNNRETFGFAGQLNLNSNPANNRFEAELFNNGLNISKGYLRVDSASDEYELTYFSGIADWLSLIGDRSLRDLRLANLDHVVNEATIVASFDHTWEDGYIYPLLNYAGNLTAKSDSNTTTSETWRPAIFVAYLVKEIFNAIGWKIDGIFNDPIFTNMVIPSYALSPKVGVWGRESGAFYQWSAIETNYETDAVLIPDADVGVSVGLTNSQGLYNPATGIFTANNTVAVRARSILLIQNEEAIPVTFTVKLYLNAVEQDSITLLLQANGAGGNSDFGEFPIDATVIMTAGDNLFFQVEATLPSSFDVISNIPLPNLPNFYSSLTFEPALSVANATNWLGYAGLPDIKQKDLIKYVIVSLGAMIHNNSRDKQVTLELFQNINQSEAIDWEGRLDNSKPHKHNYTALVEKYGRSNYLKYKVGKEDRDEEYEDVNGVAFGSGLFELTNENLAAEVDVYEAPFIGAFNVLAFSNTTLTKKPELPYISDDNSGYILVLHGKIPFGSFTAAPTTYTINGGSARSDVAYASFVLPSLSNTAVTDNGYGLAYNQEGFSQGLLRYWDNIIRILNQNQFIEAVMKLTDIDIYNLDLTKLVYIPDFESYFYVNAIPEYTGEPTKVELIKF